MLFSVFQFRKSMFATLLQIIMVQILEFKETDFENQDPKHRSLYF